MGEQGGVAAHRLELGRSIAAGHRSFGCAAMAEEREASRWCNLVEKWRWGEME
jgi:hypothetical protein